MAYQNHEIIGVFMREDFRFENADGDVIVGKLSDKRVIRGPVNSLETLKSGVRYRFFGREDDHSKYGLQFVFNSYTVEVPYGQSETVAYLSQLDGIGYSTATALWDKFGEHAIETLRETPDKCIGVGRQFNQEKAERASVALKHWQGTEHTKVSLLGLMAGKGFPKATINRAIEAWGTAAADVIRRNPYALIQFNGCGFGNTDKLYVELANKLPPAQRMARLSRIKRQALCLYYGVKSDTNGHTWFGAEDVVASLFKNLSGAELKPDKAIRLALRAGLLTSRRDCPECGGLEKIDLDGNPCGTCRGSGGKLFLTDSQRSWAEYSVAMSVVKLLSNPPAEGDDTWPDAESLVDPDDPDVDYEFFRQNQMPEIQKALSGRLSILIGSPGTGKTSMSARIIKKLIGEFGSCNVAACAFTGKAAQRLNELFAANGIKSVTATTTHRLLGCRPIKGGGFQFIHDAENPLPYKFIICDETSMKDVPLLASLMNAISVERGHLMLVGDPNQLSPVGHGCPLRDLIRSRCCAIGEFTEIRRNSGRIVRACKEIREQHTFTVPKRLDLESGENLAIYECATPELQINAIIELIKKLSSSGKYDPVWDCQIIVAVNEASQVSRKILNARLQELLNHNGTACPGNPFRVNDKIINTENRWYLPISGDLSAEDVNEDGQIRVANGRIGKVLEVFPKYTLILITGTDIKIRAPHGIKSDDSEGSSSDWEIAYAITCHKFQGSEGPIGLVVIDDSVGATMVCSREWMTTALSRFKVACVMVGKASRARSFCLRSSLNARKTFLVERITEILKKQEAASTNEAKITQQ